MTARAVARAHAHLGSMHLKLGGAVAAKMCELQLRSLFVVLMPYVGYQHVQHAGHNAGGLVPSAVFAMSLMARPLCRLLMAGWVLPILIWLVPILRWAPWLSVI